MEIKDFIKVKEEENTAVEEPKKERKKPFITYSVLAENEMDFVLERKSARIEAIMAVIPSKNQFYITKTVKKKNEDEKTELSFSIENIAWFLSGLEEPLEIKDKIWISRLEKGMTFADELWSFIQKDRAEIRSGIVHVNNGNNKALLNICRESPNLGMFLIDTMNNRIEKRSPIQTNRWTCFQPFACGAFYTPNNNEYARENNIDYLLLLEKVFGLDSTRNFVNAFVERDINFSCDVHSMAALINEFYQITCDKELFTPYYATRQANMCILEIGRYRWKMHESLLGRNNPHIDARAFTEYCVNYQREGYATLSHMLGILSDDWRLQDMLNGKIIDKYPKNLSAHHQKATFKAMFVSDEYDKKIFYRRYKEAVPLEWSNEDYIVKAPQTADEMIDEAIQQNNCLRGYIPDVMEGRTSIFFLRHKKSPDKSLVTVEVRNNEIVQVKGKLNRRPTIKEVDAVSSWAKARNLSLA